MTRIHVKSLSTHVYISLAVIAILVASGCGSDSKMSASDASVEQDAGLANAVVFEDDFNRDTLGENYLDTSVSGNKSAYKIVDGRVQVSGDGFEAMNKPLWLKVKLPRNALIEIDATATESSNDIKLICWGDGQSESFGSGYNVIFAGFGTATSVISRLSEVDMQRAITMKKNSANGVTYHFSVRRQGNVIEWKIDDMAYLTLEDPEPLEGDAHSYLAFNSYLAGFYYDNLKITEVQ